MSSSKVFSQFRLLFSRGYLCVSKNTNSITFEPFEIYFMDG